MVDTRVRLGHWADIRLRAPDQIRHIDLWWWEFGYGLGTALGRRRSGVSVHVVAFAPASSAVLDEAGGVIAHGFPMTSATVESFPAQISLPLVLAVYTQGGTDYDPERFIIARSPRGETVGELQCRWHWPDNPGSPAKFRVFAPQLQLRLPSTGLYTIGFYESRHGTESPHQFPLPVLKADPFGISASSSAQRL